ncbi:arp2/3 complex subunit [Armillaria fumosa]|nr:arp2/3 complex subunit [Armillaria fumosa]
MDGAFRKIDIDAYDEDVLHEEELYDADQRDPSQVLDEAKQRQVAVRSALSKSDIAGALSIALENSPYGPTFDDAKAVTLQTVLTILSSTKSTEIPNVLKALSQEEQDTLMKYLYKGMAVLGGDVSGSVLLDWHEKLTEVAGLGCIVRTMTDRRTV